MYFFILSALSSLFSAYPDYLISSFKHTIHDATFEKHWTFIPVYLAATLDYLFDFDGPFDVLLGALFKDTDCLLKMYIFSGGAPGGAVG